MKGDFPMGPITLTGAIIVIIGWITLVEYDSFPEAERKQIIERIKGSILLILLISLMPVGIIANILGNQFGLLWMSVTGTSLILLQGLIVSMLFWKRKRWKGIFLLVVMVLLGILFYIPLFIR